MNKLFVAGLSVAVGMCFAVSGYAGVKVSDKKVVTVAKADSKKVAKKTSSKEKAKLYMIADFESGMAPNNLGGGFGVWHKDPNDQTQGCTMEFVTPGHENKGQALKIAYDVDSPNPAYNGLWMKLEDQDFSQYKKVSFWLKGDGDAGYTNRFKVEFKDSSNTSPYYVEDVSDNWALVEIPLTSFSRVADWTKMKEFVIVFEDSQATQKAGTIYIDDIALTK
ncbi:MAG: hypothetical protein A2219_04880 [Elusimicrobia bacterium RIFOXYA2_FULL_50_26]|nr:MAG: hypothetical protein A2219_04880 [Elusimicrobia bacterium RIFOXYA2_FULL_50_26]OGS23361.1 MAG: hypothetical protein A2314_08125 [Elusimicrobia bacterium RIFOXYB2_FULL_50_12]